MSVYLKNISLSIRRLGKKQPILSSTTIDIPRKSLALIGESRLEVVTILDMLCRRILPQKGKIYFNGSVSWPIGRTGPFSITVTGVQTITYFATLYKFDRNYGLQFMVSEFSNPELLSQPILKWPPILQTQFMLLLALIPNFDIYLIDTNLFKTDQVEFSKRFLELFNIRRQGKTCLITARQTKLIDALCKGAIVIKDKKIFFTNNINEALKISNKVSFSNSNDQKEEIEIDDNIIF